MKIQKRTEGTTRTRRSTSLASAINKALIAECKRYNVSKSFVIANALAYAFNISVEDYIVSDKIVKMRRVK